MAANKTVWNGVIIGMIAAVALYYITTTFTATAFVYDMFAYVSNAIFGAWPAIAGITVKVMNYILVGIVGILAGLYVEYK